MDGNYEPGELIAWPASGEQVAYVLPQHRKKNGQESRPIPLFAVGPSSKAGGCRDNLPVSPAGYTEFIRQLLRGTTHRHRLLS